MDLRHLRYVVEVSRTANFTAAAKSLGVSQPTLSHAIGALEEEFKVTLFDRSSRHVRLTAAGEAFVEWAHRILGDMDSLRSAISDHAMAIKGTLRIGTMLFFGETRLPPIIREFGALHRGVDFILEHDGARGLLASLHAGQLDGAFVNVVDGSVYPQLQFVTVDHDDVQASLPSTHRYASRARLTASELCEEPFIAYEPESGMYDAFCAVRAAADRPPKIVLRSRSTHLVRSLVSTGMGVSIGYKKYLESPGPPIANVPLGPEPIRMSIALATAHGIAANPVTRTFVEFVQRRFGA